ncbi:hypothetical protein mRhiFer1_010265 [Rhinolophus ferrumequinum]|uniref:Uncharacterized protein n=1 Tax=Rhinolophus ferrumequinum TaxID=59479 RepID=A0A7J7X5C4_RHIFE|nr:hypothetical protein mRhiFer1_010265 [Rhinolophus ferrumequinum]
MSNVVYKGKGQVPLYRIYRHSITPWGPQEGWGRQHFSLGTAAPIPEVVLGRRLGSQEHPPPAPVSAPASASFPFPVPPSPPTPYKEPQELRLRRGSCPLGHVPHVWEKKYTPLNTEHMGEGRETMGAGEAGTPTGGWAEPPASPEGGTASRCS